MKLKLKIAVLELDTVVLRRNNQRYCPLLRRAHRQLQDLFSAIDRAVHPEELAELEGQLQMISRRVG